MIGKFLKKLHYTQLKLVSSHPSSFFYETVHNDVHMKIFQNLHRAF